MKNKYVRNELGLIEGVDYKYNEDGSIDWRAMIPQEHLYPNKGYFERFNKPVPTSIEGLDDAQLLIKLAGIKELAKLRGFTEVRYDVLKSESDHVSIKCRINWIENFESNDQEILFEDVANATIFNTSNFAKKFLETIAANRAFVRCVRNFLNIHIVGADEIDTSDNKRQDTVSQAHGPISTLMKHLKLNSSDEDFNKFKETTLHDLWSSEKYRNPDAPKWDSWEDVPTAEAAKLIRILKND